uniref:Uncharacterized protein n=1 Tax=Arundo donax TaxID=35708 RepID=A0A0A9F4Z7_ARUDO
MRAEAPGEHALSHQSSRCSCAACCCLWSASTTRTYRPSSEAAATFPTWKSRRLVHTSLQCGKRK